MMLGEDFPNHIKEIYDESYGPNGRTICVDCLVDRPGGKSREKFYFWRDVWENEVEPKNYFYFKDYIDKETVDKVEAMSDKDYYLYRYQKELWQYSDEEIVAEFNNRLNSSFHNISIKNRGCS